MKVLIYHSVATKSEDPPIKTAVSQLSDAQYHQEALSGATIEL